VVGSRSFYAREGPYISAEIDRHFTGGPVPLDVGFAVSWTGHFDSYDVPIYNPNPPTANSPQHDCLNSQVNLSSFEGCIGIPLYSRGSSGLFVTPRIGLGLLYAHSVVDTSETTIGGTFFYDARHTGFAGVVRPGVQFGYATQRFAAGVEVSYMYAYGDLTPFGNSMTEFRAGLFLSYRF